MVTKFTTGESVLARFLYPFQWRDVVFVFDDFYGNTLDTVFWTASNTNGTAFAPPATQVINGVISCSTGDVNGDEAAIKSDAFFDGNHNCGMEVMWQVNVATDTQWELGFTDALTALTASAVNDIDTPSITNGATDVALVAQDQGQTLTTMAFITDGSTTNMNTTKTDLGTRTPTNATYMTARIQLARTATNVAAARCYILDENGAIVERAQHGDVLASQINGAIPLQLWGYWEPINAVAKATQIDFWAAWQDRAGS
jgi:hypothetical protein